MGGVPGSTPTNEGMGNQRMRGAGSASQMPVSYKGLGDQQQIKTLQTSPPQNVTAPLPGVPGVGHSATDQARGPSQSPQTRICISHDRVHPSQSPRKVMQLSLKLWLLAAIPWEEEEEEGAPLKGEGRVLAAVTGRELAAVRIPTGSKARGGRGVWDVPNPNVGTQRTFYLPPVSGSGVAPSPPPPPPAAQRRAGSGLCFFCAGTALQRRI